MEEGVVGRVDDVAMNLKMGVVADGGVGGSIGCMGRGDGGREAIDNTEVAIVRK